MHWDLEKDDPIYVRHTKHLKECLACQMAQAKLEQKEILLKLEIPTPIMSTDAKESFISETNEVFKRLQVGMNPKKNKTSALSLSRLLFSKGMLPVYGISFLTYLVLANFF